MVWPNKTSLFGLPRCLQVPIAAASIETLKQYVGAIVGQVDSPGRSTRAVLVKPYYHLQATPNVPLWTLPNADEFIERLHPALQVWVHVDYNGYRKAWSEFGVALPEKSFLDHVANRKAMRLRGSTHPYLRLCPVSPHVNTSGGGVFGGEGLEREFMAKLGEYSNPIQQEVSEALQVPLLLADPMDLTKMINVAPGTFTLDGVRDTQHLFYPVQK